MLAHMFSRSRQQREKERKERLEEIFRKADPFQEGRLSVEQVTKIFQDHHADLPTINEVAAKHPEGISIGEFIRFCLGTELALDKEKKTVGVDGSSSDSHRKKEHQSTHRKRRSHSTAGKRDKVDAAFHKYDSNKDGYLSKEEFGVMMRGVDPEQVERIFNSCAKSSRGEISKEDLRNALEKAKQL